MRVGHLVRSLRALLWVPSRCCSGGPGVSRDRKGCCEDWPKPCTYHEGFQDGWDAHEQELVARSERYRDRMLADPEFVRRMMEVGYE